MSSSLVPPTPPHPTPSPNMQVTITHLYLSFVSVLLLSPPNDVWLRCGLIAGLTGSVEEPCVVNMRLKPWFRHSVCEALGCISLSNCFRFYMLWACVCINVSSTGQEWASVRATLWREVKEWAFVFMWTPDMEDLCKTHVSTGDLSSFYTRKLHLGEKILLI